jgi:hypothetical protein
MYTEKRKTSFLLALAALPFFAFAGAANATTFDTSLIDPPGVYFGTGNANTHFVTNVSSNIELGLGTLRRYLGSVAPTGSNSVYNVLTGTTTVPGRTGTDWGFEFSINTNANGLGALTLADITSSLCIQDVGQGVTSCFDPSLIGDNAHALSSPTTTAQNAEALQFNGLDTRYFLPNFDINANDTYIFTLNAFVGGDLVNSVQMTDIAGSGAAAVPVPMSLGLFGLGLLGLGAVRRAKTRKAAI